MAIRPGFVRVHDEPATTAPQVIATASAALAARPHVRREQARPARHRRVMHANDR
ncbi:hypothetical protein L810_1432 [Burkholderia sp. AU4i]|nr:hypothetical protein L810_1432 [Burkholderia sp. AU4i]MDW9242762.1 hypothetical protein [Burkholderia cepacia]